MPRGETVEERARRVKRGTGQHRWTGLESHLGGTREERLILLEAGVRVETLVMMAGLRNAWTRNGGQERMVDTAYGAKQKKEDETRYKGLVRLCKEEGLWKER